MSDDNPPSAEEIILEAINGERILKEERDAVRWLGDNIGYGNMMTLASSLWKESLKEKGFPESGAFVPVSSTHRQEVIEELKREIDKLPRVKTFSKTKEFFIYENAIDDVLKIFK